MNICLKGNLIIPALIVFANKNNFYLYNCKNNPCGHIPECNIAAGVFRRCPGRGRKPAFKTCR